ncbi:hypothetical protein ND748_21125 [Frankia sp. AiPs1]|uniref:hypothetical protein n=1 Tax=Frankia sp. AiPs1 TaxID=573493 RepID=UPI0020432886|nr:hypothetical protein [Frankia sp. AiPs1]MCM3924158.1 hypothetical protein [Frankia sp. AiPs1]
MPQADRRLAVTWQHPVGRAIQPVAFLTFDGTRYRFQYIRNAESVADFRPLLGFPDLAASYESRTLFPLFAQRAMDPRRPDYERYVTSLGLDTDATPWEQIGRSGGPRQGDTLQLFPEPTVDRDGILRCSFLVHGIRHLINQDILVDGIRRTIGHNELEMALGRLRAGDPLRIVRQPDNPENSHARLTTTRDGFPLGWLPDLLLDDVRSLAPQRIVVAVEHVNGPDALWHLRLLARLSAKAPPGYRPFAGAKWLPYSTGPDQPDEPETTGIR